MDGHSLLYTQISVELLRQHLDAAIDLYQSEMKARLAAEDRARAAETQVEVQRQEVSDSSSPPSRMLSLIPHSSSRPQIASLRGELASLASYRYDTLASLAAGPSSRYTASANTAAGRPYAAPPPAPVSRLPVSQVCSLQLLSIAY